MHNWVIIMLLFSSQYYNVTCVSWKFGNLYKHNIIVLIKILTKHYYCQQIMVVGTVVVVGYRTLLLNLFMGVLLAAVIMRETSQFNM